MIWVVNEQIIRFFISQNRPRPGAGFQTCAWALLIKDTHEELIQPNYSWNFFLSRFVTFCNALVTPKICIRLGYPVILHHKRFYMDRDSFSQKNRSVIRYVLIILVFVLLALGVYFFFKSRIKMMERENEPVHTEQQNWLVPAILKKWKLNS